VVTFLFWNINRKPLQAEVANLAVSHNADLVILAECHVPIATMLRSLNARGPGLYRLADSLCDQVSIYTRFSTRFLRPRHDSSRFTIRQLALPARTDILIAAAHLPSKMRWSDTSQAFECAEFARTVREVEAEIGHTRTVIVGDLNMNPFEDGLLAASGLNAAMTREIASRGARTVQGRLYPFFYNPMWGRFGDTTQGPPGTYYYESSEHVATFWHMFDQVLVRPELLDRFGHDTLKILTTDGVVELLDEKGHPDSSGFSDHLPIVFELDL